MKTVFAILISAILTAGLAKGGDNMSFNIKSASFKDGDTIPIEFTCEGEDVSPELEWEDPPAGTKSYALVVEDPDAPMGTFTHWIIYDLPVTLRRLDRGLGNDTKNRDGIKHGSTDFGRTGYGGPCPPKGHGRHRYYFTLRALDVPTLGIRDGARKSELEKAMKGHVLGETGIMGVYHR